ncbi:hypothetical protein Taro_034477 [Colocasia esculenta]|uniref:GATA transcription factor n=1 Tax=Colocasia esculenta TaxID=4460 RepID=A0A843VXW2_COLES|nr:hypothetical protein [Colocasia esculenta]
MEAPDLIHGGCYRGGSRQFGMEKQGKAGDPFVVEDLLDFSNDDDGLCGGDGLGFETAAADSTLTALDSSSNSSGCDPHFAGDPGCPSFSDGLSVPCDEIAELEWLSNFVEESFSSEDLQRLQLISGVAKPSSPASASGVSTGGEPTNGVPSVQSGAALFRAETHVPGKARSKRSRPAPSSWSSRLLVLSPTTSSSEFDAVAVPPLPNSNSPARKLPKPGKKKDSAAVVTAAVATELLAPDPDGRKCLHCATDKTPQWRTGPMGPKTLCNACGVRYKSGRLVPEYRPAASPTFVPSKHSNSHRKVLELRRQKEVQQHGGPPFLHTGSVYDPPPPSGDDLLLHHRMGPDFRQLI